MSKKTAQVSKADPDCGEWAKTYYVLSDINYIWEEGNTEYSRKKLAHKIRKGYGKSVKIYK